MKRKILFLVRTKSQAQYALRFYLRNRKANSIILFPLNNKTYYFYKKKGINLNNVTKFFFKKTQTKYFYTFKLIEELALQKYFKKFSIGGKHNLFHLFELNLANWLAILLENYNFIVLAVEFFKPDQIIAYTQKEIKGLSYNDLDFPLNQIDFKRINPKLKITLLKEKDGPKITFFKQPYFFWTKIILINFLKNPLVSWQLVYFYLKNRFSCFFSKLSKHNYSFNLLFFVTRHQVINITPLVKRIEKENKLSPQIITYGLKINEILALEKNKINYLDLNKLIKKNTDQKNRKAQEDFFEEAIKFLERKKTELTITNFFKKKNLSDLAKPTYQLIIKTMYRYLKPFLSFYYFEEKLFKNLKPDLIIMIEINKPSNILLEKQAKKRNIPVLWLQSGFFDKHESFGFFADYFSCWGNYTRKLIKQRLKKQNPKIKVCGNYYLKVNDYNLNRLKAGSTANTFNKKINITFLTAIYMSEFKHAVTYFELKKKIEGLKFLNHQFKFILRTHPGQEFPGFPINKDPSSLIHVLEKSDIIVTEDTSAGFTALFYQKPIIYFNPCYKNFPSPFLDYEAVFKAETVDNIINLIKKIVANPVLVKNRFENQQKLIKDHFFKLDDNSTQRLICFIKEILSHQHPKQKLF